MSTMNQTPNYIYSNILQLILNNYNYPSFYLNFIQKFTLITSQWNRDIITRLCIFKPFNVLRRDDPIFRLIKRYDIHYSINYVVLFSSFLSDTLPHLEHVEGISIPLDILDNLQTIFPNLKSLEVTGKSQPLHSIEKYKSIPNVKIVLNSMDINRKVDIMFNQEIFSKIVLSRCTIASSINFDSAIGSPINHKLAVLDLTKIKIDIRLFKHILSHSPTLHTLKLMYIPKALLIDMYNVIIELSNTLKMPLLNTFTLINNKTTFDKLIALLNSIRATNVTIDLNICLDYKPTSLISNPQIKSINFGSIEIDDIPHQTITKKKINLFEHWRDFGSLHAINLRGFFQYPLHVNPVSNFSNLTYFKDTSNCNDDQIVINKHLNLYSLVLSNGKNLTTFVAYRFMFKEFIDLLSNPPAMLTKIEFDLLVGCTSESDRDKLFTLLKNNKTIHSLSIDSFHYSTPYGVYKAYLYILKENHSLVKLKLPFKREGETLTEEILQEFSKWVTTNTNLIHLALVTSFNCKLSDLLNKYFIITEPFLKE
ncbi:hypothetical protein DLAC_04364 [Tieghemostelium lacteum]|uniref:Uncharacterized protein n=1 Tax=Tieghemostelium lacteum TaxID=361077 RepID=A0A151ZJU3_TIELA|nr:hypothetical protein DLAC_04364 [Tieghemostelium lacteum]|eukprot:KYQ94084.1 hypothetical protein DLAC_04364 [Tieghemostelium lacteum]